MDPEDFWLPPISLLPVNGLVLASRLLFVLGGFCTHYQMGLLEVWMDTQSPLSDALVLSPLTGQEAEMQVGTLPPAG